jgi:hypothetical protein
VRLRDPVWDFSSPQLDETVPDALVGIVLGLFFEAVAIGAVAVAVYRGRARARAAGASHGVPRRVRV